MTTPLDNMVLILNGNSGHVTHEYRLKIRLVTDHDIIKCLRKIKYKR